MLLKVCSYTISGSIGIQILLTLNFRICKFGGRDSCCCGGSAGKIQRIVGKDIMQKRINVIECETILL
jgi:hypothetical protein